MTYWYLPACILGAWIGSHIIKEIVHVYRTGSFSWYTLLFETGGMPSSHAAAVSAITIGILLQEGFGALFWLSFVIAAIVVRDASGVRKSVSDQALVLNKLLAAQNAEEKVEIALGHTPLQVVAGIFLGAGVAAGLWFGMIG